MSHELVYTSAPRGLQPGSNGFCTVAATRMPALLMERLEALSGYKAIFPPLDPNAPRNPVNFAHYLVNIQGKNHHVLSRVCAAGLDYTQRSNKYAHHVVLEPNELPPGGPAWVLSLPGFMETAWDQQVRQIPQGRIPPRGDCNPPPCRTWHELTGDAGWAGVLAEQFESDLQRPVYLVYRLGMDPLPLILEAISVLPPEKRWQVTFSTYVTNLPQGVSCSWRCVPREAPETADLLRTPGALVIELDRKLGPAQGNGLVERARTGRAYAAPQPTMPPAALGGGLPPPRSPTQRYQVVQRPVSAQVAPEPTVPEPALPDDAPAAPPPPLRVSHVGPLLTGGFVGILLASAIFAGIYFGSVKPKFEQERTELEKKLGDNTDTSQKEGKLLKQRISLLEGDLQARDTQLSEEKQERQKAAQNYESRIKSLQDEVTTALNQANGAKKIAEGKVKDLETKLADAKKDAGLLPKLREHPFFKSLLELTRDDLDEFANRRTWIEANAARHVELLKIQEEYGKEKLEQKRKELRKLFRDRWGEARRDESWKKKEASWVYLSSTRFALQIELDEHEEKVKDTLALKELDARAKDWPKLVRTLRDKAKNASTLTFKKAYLSLLADAVKGYVADNLSVEWKKIVEGSGVDRGKKIEEFEKQDKARVKDYEQYKQSEHAIYQAVKEFSYRIPLDLAENALKTAKDTKSGLLPRDKEKILGEGYKRVREVIRDSEVKDYPNTLKRANALKDDMEKLAREKMWELK